MTARGTRCECHCHFKNHGKGVARVRNPACPKGCACPCHRRKNPSPRTKAERREFDTYWHRRDVAASKGREAACKRKGASARAGAKATAELERARRRRLRAASARSRARQLEAKRQAASARAEARACRDAERVRRRELRQLRASARERRRESARLESSGAELRREALDEARSHFLATEPDLVPLFDEEAHRFKGTNGNRIREQFMEWVESWGQKEYAHWVDEQIEAGAREFERRDRERALEEVPF